jgi:hypothetical protein
MSLNAFLIMILTVVPLIAVTVIPVKAHHESYRYLSSLRSVSQRENFCVEASNSTMPWSTARNRVRKTLVVERTDVNWNLKQGGYTDFRTVTAASCYNLNNFTSPTRDSVEIEYYVEDAGNETSPDACGDTSCAAADADGPHWNGPHGRVEYQWYYVWLRADLIRGDDFGNPDTRRHVINHETGHVLGLADGGPTAPSTADPTCPTGGSVMHPSYYGCGTHLIWPSLSTDHPAVNDIIYGNP